MMHKFNIKKYYFIDKFNFSKLNNLDTNITLIWRSKYDEKDLSIIKKIAAFCRKNKRNFFLSNNFKLALKLDLGGVYISAHNKDLRHKNYSFKKNFKIVGAAHNIYETNIKKLQNSGEIFFSPIFKNKNNQSRGLYKLNFLFKLYKGKKIALGGINNKNIKLLKISEFSGFAAIDYFENKKKGPDG